MSSRDKKKAAAAAAAAAAAPPRQSTFFISGAGIDREVITTDICRYLGNDALVKPGTHQDSKGNITEGFYITAYRAPTSAQLADLRSDSQKWQEERRKNSSGGNPPRGGYPSSVTRQEIWGGALEDDGPHNPPPQSFASYAGGGGPQPRAPPNQQGTQGSQGQTGPGYDARFPPPSMIPGTNQNFGNQGPYNNPQEQQNYTYRPPPAATVTYPVEQRENRMDQNPMGPPRQVVPGQNYGPPNLPRDDYGGAGRGTGGYGYPPSGVSNMPPSGGTFNRPGENYYNPDPRDPGGPMSEESREEPNWDDEGMDYEDTPPVQRQARDNHRDNKRRHHH